MFVISWTLLLALGARGDDLPTLTVTNDDVTITQSCRIVVPPGVVVLDANNDGVLQIAASGITVEFAPGSHLRGSALDAPPDTYSGIAIRLSGHRDVTLRGARFSGYRVGLWATAADGLVLEHLDGSDNWRARLRSDALVEDGADWLYPHHNDSNEWLTNYAAALYVEDSRSLTVRNCRVRHGQNALCLDRVTEARIYDNDFSFNSGWGLALWRSSRNVISRNALDFCVRGYSHMVYNRGQDSAGILMFEQCCDNVIAENSATHGGDGLFGFAGREAMELSTAAASQPAARRSGNDRNLLIANDFSYAPAHGIEMTYSFENRFLANRLVGNAICGVWAGYSQDTEIAGNELGGNGEMGYRLERGGINIDSGRNNRIVHNTFRANRCAIHLWWAPRGRLRDWARAHLPDYAGTLIASNRFVEDELALHVRGPGQVRWGANELAQVARDFDVDPAADLVREPELTAPALNQPEYPVFGDARPVGARPALRGRERIMMLEWGPWDHESPLVCRVADSGREHVYALHNLPPTPHCTVTGPGVQGAQRPSAAGVPEYVITAEAPGVHPYTFTVRAGEFVQTIRATLVVTDWDVRVFSAAHDPVRELAAWRAAAAGPATQVSTLPRVCIQRLPRASFLEGAPATRPASRHELPVPAPTGTIVRTRLPLPAGTWRWQIVADDGVRLAIDGQVLLESWAEAHAPQRHAAELTLDAPRTVQVEVEHFRQRGYGALVIDVAATAP